jgi:hypothetical protein
MKIEVCSNRNTLIHHENVLYIQFPILKIEVRVHLPCSGGGGMHLPLPAKINTTLYNLGNVMIELTMYCTFIPHSED